MLRSSVSSPVRLRAKWVLPISSPPIEDGEVVHAGGRILEVRVAPPGPAPDVTDFGDAILMPGLVNCHTHLDYTIMRGVLEEVEFFPWIRELTARKADISDEEWVASATCGAAEATAGGVTCIGDCTDSGAALEGAMALGLSGTVYQEVFGIDGARNTAVIVEELRGKVDNLRRAAAGTDLQIGISPHAPYTVRPDLMKALGEYARAEQLRVCIHASESQAEVELIRSGTGPIAAMFNRRGIVWNVPRCGAADYLNSCEILGPEALLVHGVQLAAEERDSLIASGASWAHCPKSNAKLGNGVADLNILGMEHARNTGTRARIGIGSDSVASNNGMDLFEEMRFAVLIQRAVRRKITALSAADALEMATLGGAAALGLDHETGSLEPSKRADICVVRLGALHSTPAYDPYSALVYAAHASDVDMTIVRGVTRYDARRRENPFPGVDLRSPQKQMLAAAARMRNWRSPN